MGAAVFCLLPDRRTTFIRSRPRPQGGARAGSGGALFVGNQPRLRVTDHPFQARFGSVAMDERHLMAAARYLALNAVRARLSRRSSTVALADSLISSRRSRRLRRGRRCARRGARAPLGSVTAWPPSQAIGHVERRSRGGFGATKHAFQVRQITLLSSPRTHPSATL